MRSRRDLSCEHMAMVADMPFSPEMLMKPAGMNARAASAARMTGMTQ